MPHIKLYSTPTCVYCKMTRELFTQHHIAFEEFDVAADERAREEMIHKSGQLGVPVIDIDGAIYIGFDRRGITKALNLE